MPSSLVWEWYSIHPCKVVTLQHLASGICAIHPNYSVQPTQWHLYGTFVWTVHCRRTGSTHDPCVCECVWFTAAVSLIGVTTAGAVLHAGLWPHCATLCLPLHSPGSSWKSGSHGDGRPASDCTTTSSVCVACWQCDVPPLYLAM